MKNILVALLIGVLLCVSAEPARAQFVVSDPYLEHMATEQWFHDFQNAANLLKTATNTETQIRQQLAQYQEWMREFHTGLPQQVWRNAQNEIADLAKITQAGYSVSAYDADGAGQLRKMFPWDKGLTPLALAQQWDGAMRNTLANAANAIGIRMQQMNGEESQIAALRAMAANPNITQQQALQASLMIADQQLEELRAIERTLMQHFDTQYAGLYRDGMASGGTDSPVIRELQIQAVQDFYTTGVKNVKTSASKTSQVVLPH